MEETQNLEIQEVIDQTYQKLVKAHGTKRIRPRDSLTVKVLRNNDGHRTNNYWGKCKELNLVGIGDNRWLIGQVNPSMGKTYGDITAINVENGVTKKKILTEIFKDAKVRDAN